MDDGYRVPGMPDGMAAFPGSGGRTILIRNHEVVDSEGPFGPSGPPADLEPCMFYDYGRGTPATGGTSTIVYDTRQGRVVKQYLSLTGTCRNCAGGPTPWNSWLSCEENVALADETWEEDHGYVFEVPASESIGLVMPVPLKAMGRFNHEAVAVDSRTGIVYQTEDRNDGCIYRYCPNHPGRLAHGGRLQVLSMADQPSADTRNWPNAVQKPYFPIGQPLPVSWIDASDIQSAQDDLRIRSFQAGAARFARGEGMWAGRSAIYFACTTGGANRAGQIFRYRPSPFEATPGETSRPGTLELFLEPNDTRLLKGADNLTTAPWGDVIICEDTGADNYMVGVTPLGAIYPLARNVYNSSELCGCCFCPEGQTLFVSIQRPGMTFAIQGPWRKQSCLL